MEDGGSNKEEEVVVGEITKVGPTQEKEVHKTEVDDKVKHSKNSPQQEEHQNKQPSMTRRKLQKWKNEAFTPLPTKKFQIKQPNSNIRIPQRRTNTYGGMENKSMQNCSPE